MIIINFKNYKHGKDALKIAKAIERVDKKVIICPAGFDISDIAKNTKLKVYGQHAKSVKSKRNTGFLTVKGLKDASAFGTLLNHSEHPISDKEIGKSIRECKKLGLKTVICVGNLNRVRKVVKLKPNAIAFEDPKLIATGKSISKYRADDLEKFVGILKGTKIIPICGAGISKRKDVVEAGRFGCKGVLISSAVMKSRNPGKVLRQLTGR